MIFQINIQLREIEKYIFAYEKGEDQNFYFTFGNREE